MNRALTRRAFLALAAGASAVGVTRLAARGGTDEPARAAISPLPDVSVAPSEPSPETPQPSTTAGPVAAAAVPAARPVLCREAWGAEPIRGSLDPHRIERMTVHHTAAVLLDPAEAPAMVRGHQAFHQDDRGWADLAYHYVIDRDGNVYEGRPTTAAGDTATDYDPAGHLLVACEGNFNEQDPARLQIEALVDVLAWASVEFAVDPTTIRGHRDWANTACPGAGLYELVDNGDLAERVQARLADRGVGVRLLCGDEGRAVVAAIEGEGASQRPPPTAIRGIE